ncbi:MAG: radical SAM protein [Nanoarchaeota archaeon]|nr:radical SAM protein [Nanoarchaeota archaeon]
MKKVLVINPPNMPFTRQSLLIEPIDVLSVATFIQSLGNKVKVIDMDVKMMKPKDIQNHILEFAPSIIVIIFDYHIPLHTTESIPGINEISGIAQDNGIKVIMGGKTSNCYPKEFLQNSADIVIHGEMEPALSELFLPEEWSQESLSKILGISYKIGKRIYSTEKRIEKIDLDSLPMPDRSLIDLADYIEVRTILSSRGCFGRCKFCATPLFWGNFRARSAKNVADEIEYLIKTYSARKILFLDDNATASKTRMHDISLEIIKRKIKCRFGCLGTISTFDIDTMKIMKKAGFEWIHYGAESGSIKALTCQNKGISPEDIKRVIKQTKKIGLRVRASFILDLPEIDEKGMRDTIKLILDSKPDEIRAHFLAIRVGTEYHRTSVHKTIPSQYIHNNKSTNNLSLMPKESILSYVDELSQKLVKKGYLLINNISEWDDIKKLKQKNPDLKFISFCPARYGLGWGDS